MDNKTKRAVLRFLAFYPLEVQDIEVGEIWVIAAPEPKDYTFFIIHDVDGIETRTPIIAVAGTEDKAWIKAFKMLPDIVR